jgi:hypothetical protein
MHVSCGRLGLTSAIDMQESTKRIGLGPALRIVSMIYSDGTVLGPVLDHAVGLVPPQLWRPVTPQLLALLPNREVTSYMALTP